MVSDGVLALFVRLKKNLGLICKRYVGEGDSKSYAVVKAVLPYGCQDFIEKVECILHITKRWGSGLREVVRKNKDKLKSLIV